MARGQEGPLHKLVLEWAVQCGCRPVRHLGHAWHMPGDGANTHRPAEVVLGQRLRNPLPEQGCGPGQPGWVSGKTGEGSLSFRHALGGRVGGLGLI